MGITLMTGAPGWLAESFFRFVGRSVEAGGELRRWRCLVQPGGDGLLPKIVAPDSIHIEVVPGDLSDPDSLTRACCGVDRVLHAAGIIHVRRTADWYRINTEGTRHLLRASLASGVKRFVYISSNAAGGRSETTGQLMTEAAPPRPLSHYGRSKWQAEQVLAEGVGKMETVILRPCMFYGPPVPHRHVEIYHKIMDGRIPLIGHGRYDRSLTHVDNLAQAIHLALLHPAAAGQTYYVADEEIYSTRAVLEAMAEALGVPLRTLPLPGIAARVAYRADLALARWGFYWQTLHLVGESDWNVGVSIGKIKRDLGFQPTIGLAAGMREAVHWCRQRGLLELAGRQSR